MGTLEAPTNARCLDREFLCRIDLTSCVLQSEAFDRMRSTKLLHQIFTWSLMLCERLMI